MFLLVALLLAGCGEGQGSTPEQEQATRELQETQRELRKERRKLQRERRRERPPADAPSEETASDDSGGGSTGDTAGVPDVEGKDHQLAQDTMQAAGFYILSEEDASGEVRPILYDRNWTVVSQSPKAGTDASLDRTIVLRAKKDGE